MGKSSLENERVDKDSIEHSDSISGTDPWLQAIFDANFGKDVEIRKIKALEIYARTLKGDYLPSGCFFVSLAFTHPEIVDSISLPYGITIEEISGFARQIATSAGQNYDFKFFSHEVPLIEKGIDRFLSGADSALLCFDTSTMFNHTIGIIPNPERHGFLLMDTSEEFPSLSPVNALELQNGVSRVTTESLHFGILARFYGKDKQLLPDVPNRFL